MVWFKVDDGMPFHAKTVAAGNAAMGLWVRAGAWSAGQLTDGFVPDHMVRSLGTAAQASVLVKVRLWERADGGYRFWQWNAPGRQPSRVDVEARRDDARERMANARSSEHVRANKPRSSRSVPQPRPDPTRPEGSEEPLAPADKRRGTRLADDWKPSAELVEAMRTEGIPDDLARRELPKFRDYWAGKPGKDGRKADWDATWRNWLRRALGDLPAQRKPADPATEWMRDLS